MQVCAWTDRETFSCVGMQDESKRRREMKTFDSTRAEMRAVPYHAFTGTPMLYPEGNARRTPAARYSSGTRQKREKEPNGSGWVGPQINQAEKA